MAEAVLQTDSDDGPLGAVVSYELAEIVRRFNVLERKARRPEKWDRWNIRTFLNGMKVPIRGELGGKKYVLLSDLKESGLLDSVLDAESLAEDLDDE